MLELLPALQRLDGPRVFFPVRHHSPACARTLRAVARAMRPRTILIEGPSDFNEQMAELLRPHQLPVAIYSWVQLAGGERAGVYYPFCRYSPEWQAVEAARELGCAVRFCDLPQRALDVATVTRHRYADRALRVSPYVPTLCAKVGVEDFDALWDTLFEVPELSPEDFVARVHAFCLASREENPPSPSDLRREAHMAAAVEAADAPVLVVTGGYHSGALLARVEGLPHDGAKVEEEEQERPACERSGLALTPYSYERLDNLGGYEAGMPGPGFYRRVWDMAEEAPGKLELAVLGEVVTMLRERGQVASAADLIAVRATAQGLARMRGQARVWRRELLDAIRCTLVKEELAYGLGHPFLRAVREVFRGDARGRLAAGTRLPGLVADVAAALAGHGLAEGERVRALDLTVPEQRAASQVLHRLRVLGVPGYQLIAPCDFISSGAPDGLTERWELVWTPDTDARVIEAAIYGSSLREACIARLEERAAGCERDAFRAAGILLDAVESGVQGPKGELYARLTDAVRACGDFFSLARALATLLTLYRYDEVFGVRGDSELGALLAESYTRGLWLLEQLGLPEGQEEEYLDGVRALVSTFERCGAELDLDREELLEVLRRTAADSALLPCQAGAACGALYALGELAIDALSAALVGFAAPDSLGDFLRGVFALAREELRSPGPLLEHLDTLLMGFDEDGFLSALPALRLAFASFTPREKHYLVQGLLRGAGTGPTAPLEVGAGVVAAHQALEGRLWELAARYGLWEPDDG